MFEKKVSEAMDEKLICACYSFYTCVDKVQKKMKEISSIPGLS